MIVGKRETSVFALRAMAAPGARTLTSTPPRGAAHTARSAGGVRAGMGPDGPRGSRRRQVTSAGQEGQPGGGCGGSRGRPGSSQKGVI